jgi:hypothetical protein
MLIAVYLKMLSKSNDNGVFAVCAQATEINDSPQRRRGRRENTLFTAKAQRTQCKKSCIKTPDLLLPVCEKHCLAIATEVAPTQGV